MVAGMPRSDPFEQPPVNLVNDFEMARQNAPEQINRPLLERLRKQSMICVTPRASMAFSRRSGVGARGSIARDNNFRSNVVTERCTRTKRRAARLLRTSRSRTMSADLVTIETG